MYCKCGNRIDYSKFHNHHGEDICQSCVKMVMTARWDWRVYHRGAEDGIETTTRDISTEALSSGAVHGVPETRGSGEEAVRKVWGEVQTKHREK